MKLDRVADVKSESLHGDHWSLSLWLFAILMNFSFALSLWAAFDTRVATIDFFLTLFLTIYLSVKTPIHIRSDEDWLYVGKAKIEKKYLGTIETLGKREMALARTRDANLDAYLDLRFWIPTGVRITINDKRDYTPYWLISTRKGAELKEMLES